jgi:hypothetical protein
LTEREPTEEELAERQLEDEIASYTHDPLGWVYFSFDWGKGDLAGHDGPDDWQIEILSEIGKQLKAGTVQVGEVFRFIGKALKMAVASGHGIGKSALVCWIILWALSTHQDARGVVTANTQVQLATKTWPELGKWHRMFIASHWFIYESTSIHSADPKHSKNWRFDAIPWTENRSEAFAGLHNQDKRMVLIFDEASAISDKIWEVAEGALTDKNTEIMWFAFGNPTRNTGRFFDCFHKQKERWFPHLQIDSRKAKQTNKIELDEMVKYYGEDSDIVRVRVRGVFPKVGDRQYIGYDLIQAAKGRHVNEGAYNFAAKILTLDNAWTGADEIVIGLRQGLCYQQLMTLAKNDDDGEIAGFLMNFEDTHGADAVFIDMGLGTGVFSFGKSLKRKWTLVPFGGKSAKVGYANKRAEMYGGIKDWLMAGGCIPDDEKLCEELAAPEYIVKENGETLLEKKEDIKKRLGFSPGRADALALSFAFPVQPKHKRAGAGKPETTGHEDLDVLA